TPAVSQGARDLRRLPRSRASAGRRPVEPGGTDPDGGRQTLSGRAIHGDGGETDSQILPGMRGGTRYRGEQSGNPSFETEALPRSGRVPEQRRGSAREVRSE